MWKKHWTKRKRQEDRKKGYKKVCLKGKKRNKEAKGKKRKYGWKDVKEKMYTEDVIE